MLKNLELVVVHVADEIACGAHVETLRQFTADGVCAGFGLAHLEHAKGSVGYDDGVGSLEAAVLKKLDDRGKGVVESKRVFLESPKGEGAAFADLARAGHVGGVGLVGENGEEIALLDEHLHDAGIDGAEDGLGDNSPVFMDPNVQSEHQLKTKNENRNPQVHGIGLLSHLGLLESVFHLEGQTVALLVGFSALKASLDLRSGHLLGHLSHEMVESGPLGPRDPHAVV